MRLFTALGFFMKQTLETGATYRSRRRKRRTNDNPLRAAAWLSGGSSPAADSALLLSRLLGGIRRPWTRTVVAALLSLMLVYGLANMVNDLWIEQVVKRGWTSWEVPDVLVPRASLAWAALLLSASLCYALFFSSGPLLARRR